jgi:hypothetical protein
MCLVAHDFCVPLPQKVLYATAAKYAARHTSACNILEPASKRLQDVLAQV